MPRKRSAQQLARDNPLTLIVREQPRDGLSGAVLEGMKRATGDVLVVMDADLQHPPEKLLELITPLEQGQADFILGSRYVPGGSTAGQWGIFRKINSWVATLLARPFAGRTTDPMSGFFALKHSTYSGATRLTPLGYKIGLELMCKCRVQRVKEIPIHFALRQRGQSKLTLKQQFKYLEHLSRLYDYTFPRGSPIVKFAIATIVGWFAGFAAYATFLSTNALPTATLGPIFAYPFTIFAIAIFHLRYVRSPARIHRPPPPLAGFLADFPHGVGHLRRGSALDDGTRLPRHRSRAVCHRLRLRHGHAIHPPQGIPPRHPRLTAGLPL